MRRDDTLRALSITAVLSAVLEQAILYEEGEISAVDFAESALDELAKLGALDNREASPA